MAHEEPLTFAAGDTLWFQKYFPDWLPSNGFALQYEVRGGARGNTAVIFNSTPDTTNTRHYLNVLPPVTALWFPGEYVLAGEVINANGYAAGNLPAGWRKAFYLAPIIVTPNLQTGANDANVKTHLQKMIEYLECQLEELAKNPISLSDIQGVKIQRERRKDLQWQLGYNRDLRRQEVAQENINNRRPSGYNITPAANIVRAGPYVGSGPSWPFSPP